MFSTINYPDNFNYLVSETSSLPMKVQGFYFLPIFLFSNVLDHVLALTPYALITIVEYFSKQE